MKTQSRIDRESAFATGRGGWSIWKTLLASLAAATLVAVALGYGPMINSGDWWRICPSGHFTAMGWQPLQETYPLSAKGAVPSSVLALLVQIGLWLQLAWGSQVYWTPLVFIALCAMFLGGCLVAARACGTRADHWALASVILVGALYGFYFKSFYQEATTLALLPWFLGGLFALREGRPGLFVVVTCLMLGSKVENLFVIPIALAALALHAYPRKRTWLAVALLGIAATAGLSFLVQHGPDYRTPNDYNRYYSGIGWSSMGLEDAPPRTFDAMRRYAYARLPKSLGKPEAMPSRDAELMGTTYWMTGYDLSVLAAAGSPADKARFREIVDRGSLGNFLGYFARNPGALPGYLWAPLKLAVRFDYDLSYIRTEASRTAGAWSWLRAADEFVLARLGYLLLGAFAAALLAAARRRSLRGALLAGYFFLGAPLFCVLGDGYYEFEKHLTSLWFFAPLVVFLCVTDFAPGASGERGVRPGR